MDITGLNKAELLTALYNSSKQQGIGLLDPAGVEPMTRAQAREILAKGTTYFDYLKGRVMKVDIGGNDMETALYNRDHGPGAAERIINRLRS